MRVRISSPRGETRRALPALLTISRNFSGRRPRSERPSAEDAWKWTIRKKVWDLVAGQRVVKSPKNRTPNFEGAAIAAHKLGELSAFRDAKVVNVGPEVAQAPVRLMTLRERKKLIVPCLRRLVKEFLAEVDPNDMTQEELDALTDEELGLPTKPLQLSPKAAFEVDLVVLGSVAVDPKTGARIGDGQGLEDLNYALLRYMEAIDSSTPVVTTVHEKQLVDDIPVEKMMCYDVPADIICTPERTIFTSRSFLKPDGIFWESLQPEKLSRIHALQMLKKSLQKEMRLPMAPSLSLAKLKRSSIIDEPCIFLSELCPSVTERQLQRHLEDLGVRARKVLVFKASRKIVARAMVDEEKIDAYVKAINASTRQLDGWSIRARRDSSAIRTKAREKEPLGD
ncbi:5-formyltetrahydrofolate cyclo-ligase-like protein COG0212 [Selaginella moellendorffii]|uniref:5-formyltetrahydrofolate cyclo-ligase-like protein COG0212 n=1 Tax=Selaginella moellendorffii TaxID=88036 RepID=UPI000D1CBE84|nr:5-formyltetrahydrofolate cyclo-ligase-like protein COG0212 [Selaginella moellendorffii]|eukprot:XP_024521970.1 5-formyltetrahydrofolate cyclo-ligase-like protein COG0212 [Selaginella moellendorffii]